MSENCEERFLSVLKEAKAIFDKKSKEGLELLTENEELQQQIEQLKTDKKELLSKQESLLQKMTLLESNVEKSQNDLEKVTDELTKSKKFLKKYFQDLLNRMTEVEERGVYDARAFSYLVGDVGRSLSNTSFVGKGKLSPSKKQGTHKLSTNKVKKRSRYENIAPLDLHKITTALTKDDTAEDASTYRYQNVKLDKRLKKAQPSEKISETIPGNNSNNEKNKDFLDPNLTLHSPIGPPSRASTPQEPCSGNEWKDFEKSNMTVGRHTSQSPSLLSGLDMEDLQCSLLPRLVSLDGEIPEMSEPQSPTIPSRSSHMTSKKTDVSLEYRRTKRKRNLDMTFGSLLGEPENCDLRNDMSKARPSARACKSGLVGGRCPKDAEECKSQDPTVQHPAIYSDIIFLDDSNFVKPNAVSVPRKRPKTCSGTDTRANSSSLLLFSPQHTKSPVETFGSCQVNEKSHEQQQKDVTTENESDVDDKPRLVFRLNVDESSVDEKPLKRDEQCEPYKYIEVVRGKDNRAKLNGYFCADCEKYYGSLKLSEEEFQERLKACSRHRARFSPPPSTPEHFWEVDFMDTHEYIEKGFMRSEAELPPEKRKLRSRRTKGKSMR